MKRIHNPDLRTYGAVLEVQYSTVRSQESSGEDTTAGGTYLILSHLQKKSGNHNINNSFSLRFWDLSRRQSRQEWSEEEMRRGCKWRCGPMMSPRSTKTKCSVLFVAILTCTGQFTMV